MTAQRRPHTHKGTSARTLPRTLARPRTPACRVPHPHWRFRHRHLLRGAGAAASTAFAAKTLPLHCAFPLPRAGASAWEFSAEADFGKLLALCLAVTNGPGTLVVVVVVGCCCCCCCCCCQRPYTHPNRPRPKRASTSLCTRVYTQNIPQKTDPFSVARLKVDLPFHNRLALNRVHRSCQPSCPGAHTRTAPAPRPLTARAPQPIYSRYTADRPQPAGKLLSRGLSAHRHGPRVAPMAAAAKADGSAWRSWTDPPSEKATVLEARKPAAFP